MDIRHGQMTRPPADTTAETQPDWIITRERRRFGRSGQLQFYVREAVVWTRIRDGLTETHHERIAGPVPRAMAEAIVVARENAARVAQLEPANAAYADLIATIRAELDVIGDQLAARAENDPALRAIVERIGALERLAQRAPGELGDKDRPLNAPAS